MKSYVDVGGLAVAEELYNFVSDQLLSHASMSNETVWGGFEDLLKELGPLNRSLLEKRDQLQEEIDGWHKKNAGRNDDLSAYKAFLYEIGYLIEEGPDFTIETANVDPEISEIAGPQLVVPVSNARFALNAANARWGSLYDALYGTNVIPPEPGLEQGAEYNPDRGDKVVAYALSFLDKTVPLSSGSHRHVVQYFLEKEERTPRWHLRATLADDQIVSLAQPCQFQGYLGHEEAPSTILLRNNGLHIEIQIDRDHPIGRTSRAGIKDIVLEAALTVIQDFEDSVAAVDVYDKVAAYRNWAGLVDGSLKACLFYEGKQHQRKLNQDRIYIASDNKAMTLNGRSLLLVRNVGHLTTTDCILDRDGDQVPEGFLDAFITSLCALPDIEKRGGLRNSRMGSFYIVKPKLHGPDEVALTNLLFSKVEQVFGLDQNTIKIGVMDEERRTSVNLKECIRAVKDRIMFINTGFLDRTGDEIHTNMEAGAVPPKEQIKSEPWLLAYEKRNVAIGLACGFRGKAQIGKGMWPKPDEMAQMVATKQAHLQAGADCAWVPSPTAAVLHAMHYHDVDVHEVQAALASVPMPAVDTLLKTPLLEGRALTDAEIQAEINNNLQGILGYVVRWIDQGIGCSKVPDVHNVALMEDRATLRISSQHVANWLHHGICSETQVRTALEEMARIVDQQNATDPNYRPMGPIFSDSLAFAAVTDLVFKGRSQPNGYTELILHEARRRAKKAL